jgi:outer membrane usher protein
MIFSDGRRPDRCLDADAWVIAMGNLKRTLLASAVALALVGTNAGAVEGPRAVREAVEEVEFSPQFLLGGGGAAMDVSAFEAGESVPAGVYTVEVSLNGDFVTEADVTMGPDERGVLRACVSAALLAEWGVDTDKVAHAATSPATDGQPVVRALPIEARCEALDAYIPEANAVFAPGEMTLRLSVPQLYVSRSARGWVDSSHWDPGITAALLRYNVNAYRTRDERGRTIDMASTGLQAGFNMGAWRLRHNGYLRWAEGEGRRYDVANTFLQREIRPWNAQMEIGQGYTRGDLFNSVGFTGAHVYSDDRMLPDSQRGFAPVVRGLAATNARVSVYQQGRLIHEISVAPGPFEIDDLYATAYSGDIEVVVTEADGREQRFTQSFAAVPQLLRPGQSRFSLTAGRTRLDGQRRDPYLLESTWRHGIDNRWTAFAGARASQDYRAILAGVAVNTTFGALGADVTASRARVPGGEQRRGQSYRITYSKDVFATGTNVSVAAYRYSTSQYLELYDVLRMHDQSTGGVVTGYVPLRQRSRFEINIGQSLPGTAGRLWANGSTVDYWNRSGKQTTFTAGYANQWRRMNFTVTAQRTHLSLGDGLAGRMDNSLGITVSMPLGNAPRSPLLMASAYRATGGNHARVGVLASPSERFSYGLGTDRAEGSSASLDANASWMASAGTVTGYYNRQGRTRYQAVGMQGGLVVHGGGVTFANQLGDTIGLVHAPDAYGAQLPSFATRVDRRGYAVVPYMQPYRRAEVSLDPKGLPDEVSFTSTSAHAVPTLGAVVSLSFATERSGRVVSLHANRPGGEVLPFGAQVLHPDGTPLGIVGQAGQIWVHLPEAALDHVLVRWGNALTETCRVRLDTAEEQATCQPFTGGLRLPDPLAASPIPPSGKGTR